MPSPNPSRGVLPDRSGTALGSLERTFLGVLPRGVWRRTPGHGRHRPTASLPSTDKLRRTTPPLRSPRLGQEGSPVRACTDAVSLSLNHCCSGACLGDGAVVTTTVETALEDPEAVPC